MVFSQIDCKKPREIGGSVGSVSGLCRFCFVCLQACMYVCILIISCQSTSTWHLQLKASGAGHLYLYRWKYSFTTLVGEVLAQTTGATTTNYRGMLEFDHKLREFPIPPELVYSEPGSPGSLQEVPITLTLQRYIIRLWRHASSLFFF